jgi:nucleotide-binding universal stress UspA family protein
MKKILVALDGSPRQEGVLKAASELARRTNAKLVLFRAVTLPGELPPEAYLIAEADLTTVLERRARVDLEAAAKGVPSDLLDELRVAIGTPWDSICRTAKELEVDLVVIGSHGYDTLDRILGTTAGKVVNHADRAVLVVRAPERLVRP